MLELSTLMQQEGQSVNIKDICQEIFLKEQCIMEKLHLEIGFCILIQKMHYFVFIVCCLVDIKHNLRIKAEVLSIGKI